jgi:hypothetical protein
MMWRTNNNQIITLKSKIIGIKIKRLIPVPFNFMMKSLAYFYKNHLSEIVPANSLIILS